MHDKIRILYLMSNQLIATAGADPGISKLGGRCHGAVEFLGSGYCFYAPSHI